MSEEKILLLNKTVKNGLFFDKITIFIQMNNDNNTIINQVLKNRNLLEKRDELVVNIDRDKKIITINNIEQPKEIDKNQIVSEKKQIFISHSSKEKEQLALPLYNFLESYNLNPWIDKKNMKGSDSLFVEINNGIKESDSYVVILSSAFVKSNWTIKEFSAIFT